MVRGASGLASIDPVECTPWGSPPLPVHLTALVHPNVSPGATATLRFEWAAANVGAVYGEALLALFGPAAEAIEADTVGGPREAADVDEALRLARSGAAALRFFLPVGRLAISLVDGAVELPAPILAPDAVGAVWLQAHPLPRCPVAIVATRLPARATPEELLHALVGVAHRCSPLRAATFGAIRWAVSSSVGECVVTDGAHWSRTGTEGGRDSGLRVSGLPSVEAPDPGLIATLASRLEAGEDLASLAALLTPHVPIPIELSYERSTAPFHTPPPPDSILRLVPRPDRVIIEFEQLDPRAAAIALAHAAAHLRLGHLRPGDPFGHWDTPDTAFGAAPERRWDREVRERIPAWAPPPAPRRATLAECSPVEKSWLVLLHHIGQMVGEARGIHPRAAAYQPAAYQRQAAQRLVAQLEEHGGAMLCDGVGLGKTYVATTVMVHYANHWRDRLASSGRSSPDDPFRVTVLAPHSVVSTWRREALPSLAAFGVPLATVRVVSHAGLSRILGGSAILDRDGADHSDFEHLLLSDLVIVDEAHNFRSVAARRTATLRDVLRLQPRKDVRRRVLLLTATPVNNSLDDLRQEISLLFSKPLWFNANITPEGYRARVPRDIEERVAKARRQSGEVSATLVHGAPDAKFSTAIDFRDDLNLGVQVQSVGDYLKEQDKRLALQQLTTRARLAGEPGAQDTGEPVRVAADLLDRIVVQRSRALCKQIEREQGSDVELLFRPDAPAPERLVYEDVYDDTHDVLAGFLPLFAAGENAAGARPRSVSPLSLKVYMWADVRDDKQAADATSSVVGLQRVLVLKRLESSPVSFLITLLRLLALHAHRLKQLSDLCHDLGARARGTQVDDALREALAAVDADERERLDLLLGGSVSKAATHLTGEGRDLLARWSLAHKTARPASGEEDVPPTQLEMFARAADDAQTASRREQLDRLWGLADDLVRDFGTLLAAAPGLAELVFGRFDRADWPRRFIAGGEAADWPTSSTWGLRLVTDAKIRRLVERLLRARAEGQKIVVFSQFTDTLAYVGSVFRATASFDTHEWQMALNGLEAGCPVSEDDVRDLVGRTRIVSGATDDRDALIDAFAPFYRIGPRGPNVATAPSSGADPEEQASLLNAWRQGWSRALREPVDVLLASDVLAEGVNLQDAALLVNFDVHWNPVRMIQRAGRIDRRLNPAVEHAIGFPELDALAAELDLPAPRYWWHGRKNVAPVTVNLLLSDELEAELQLRERIANKTLAIDFTLGLEQGTGAEADWMADYRYQGISALNAWQRDRAIEQVAGYQERLRRVLGERGIDPAWVESWNGWLREKGAGEDAPLVAWARVGPLGGAPVDYTRHLLPQVADAVPHWLWTTARPARTLLNFWLRLDGLTKVAPTRTDLPWSEDASRPVAAEDLLGAARRLVDGAPVLDELGGQVGRPLYQGVAAIAAGYLGGEADRKALKVGGFRIVQLQSFRSGAAGRADAPAAAAGVPSRPSEAPVATTARMSARPRAPRPDRIAEVPRHGIARACPICDAAAGMHKCCPSCSASANGEPEVEERFGFRRPRDATYAIPQTWCRPCRTLRPSDPAAEPDPAHSDSAAPTDPPEASC